MLNLSMLSTDKPAVLDQCALKRDLELFDAGDLTEVGEKGLTLRYARSLSLSSSSVLTIPTQRRPESERGAYRVNCS